MHICFTIANNSSVPYFGWFMEKASKNPELKFSFIALTDSRPDMIDEAKSFGFNGYWIHFSNKKRKTGMIVAFFKLLKLFRKLKPDVVHTHLFDDSVPALLAARMAGIKKRVITKQDTSFHYYYAPRWKWFDRFNNSNATHVVATSNECKNFILEKEKCKPSKVSVIHHGIPVGEYTDPDKDEVIRLRSLYAPNGEFLVGTLARFIEWKRHEDIVEVARIVSANEKNIRFLFFGNGPLESDIKDLIMQYHLEDKVILAGFYPRDKIKNVFGALDLYLHAAFMEPFGFVIAEAMAAGLPVVSTPTGAALDGIVHKKSGWIAEYNNKDALAEGIRYFYRNPVEKPWKPAVDISEKLFDFNIMYNNYLNLYGV
jgi:glycosyltransferase involved in cell wall biosynthesis